MTAPLAKRLLVFALLVGTSIAAETPANPAPNPAAPPGATPFPLPKPTVANVAYGPHERQVLDFYKAEGSGPTPVVLFIHGGGWVRGDKNGTSSIAAILKQGVSFVSINYRFVQQAQFAGERVPVKWPLEDAARALQFVRSKAAEWNIDKQRIAAAGGSAGAFSSLWLAFHPDLADPASKDPVARESTRLWCAAVIGAQTSLDPKQLREWTPNSRYGGHAFGFMDPNDLNSRDRFFEQFYAARDQWLPEIRAYSPYELVTADDAPVFMTYDAPPGIGEPQKDPTHTANYGVKLQEKMKGLGVPCEVYWKGLEGAPHTSIVSYLAERLKAAK